MFWDIFLTSLSLIVVILIGGSVLELLVTSSKDD